MRRLPIAVRQAVVATLALLLVVSAPLALAKKKKLNPLYGNLKSKSKRHHTVIVVDPDGDAVTVRASPFRVVPNAPRFTLHIRKPDGSYGGPVVASRSGRRVVMGFREGAHLGVIRPRAGYYVLDEPLDARFQDSRNTARAVRGAPVGTRSLGLVRGRPTRRLGRGQDQDGDGLPGAFDVDTDGDRILNNVDQSSRARASARGGFEAYRVMSLLSVGLKQSFLADQMGLTHGIGGYALNQYAISPTITTAEFERLRDLAAKIRSSLVFTLPSGDDQVELDCGGLTYCSLGPDATGRDVTQSKLFPQEFDADHDGFGTMAPTPLPLNPQRDGIGVSERLGSDAKVFVLKPMAEHFSDVKEGDTFIERVSRDGSEVSQQPVMLNYTFGTVPALASWSDGTQRADVTYPVPSGGEGVTQNPYRSTHYPDGVLTFTIWRPQRRAFPGERGDWVDVGHLLYTAAGFLEGLGGDRPWTCPTSAYSTRDPNLRLESDGLRDLDDDAPLDRTRTLTFSVDIGACLRHSKIDPAGMTASSAIYFTASSDFGDAAEGGGFSFSTGTREQGRQFSGTWRFTPETGNASIDWILQANSFSTNHFGIKVNPPFSLTGGTSPPGWHCEVLSQSSANDLWFCQGSSLAAGSSVAGTITLPQPGTTGMGVDGIAPTAAGSSDDMGYGLTYAP